MTVWIDAVGVAHEDPLCEEFADVFGVPQRFVVDRRMAIKNGHVICADCES